MPMLICLPIFTAYSQPYLMNITSTTSITAQLNTLTQRLTEGFMRS